MSSRHDVLQKSSNPVLLHLNIEEAISAISYFFERKPSAISRFFDGRPSRRSNFELLVRRALGSEAIITPAATLTTVDQLDGDIAISGSDAATDHTQHINEDRSGQPGLVEAPTPQDTDEGEIHTNTNQRAGTASHHNTPEPTSIKVEALDQRRTPPSNPFDVSGETSCSDAAKSLIGEEGLENLLHAHIEKIADETKVGHCKLELSTDSELELNTNNDRTNGERLITEIADENEVGHSIFGIERLIESRSAEPSLITDKDGTNRTSLPSTTNPTPSILSRKRKAGANQKDGAAKVSTQISGCEEETPDLDLRHIRAKLKKIASQDETPNSNLLQHIRAKMQKIASHEAITSLWYSYRAARSWTYGYNQGDIVDDSHHSSIRTREASILQRLRMLQRCIEKSRSVKQFATALERFHMAEVVSLYAEATAQKKHAGRTSQGSLVDQFASILFPDTIQDSRMKVRGKTKQKTKRNPLKMRFDSYMKKAKPWARLVERYGGGILLLIPEDLTNEDLRRLDKADLDLVLNYIDILNPLLKDHVAGLTFVLLPCLIEFGCLPAQKLMLETLSEDQVLSRQHTRQSIAVLLQYCEDNVKSYAMDQPDPALTLGVAGYHASMVEQPAYRSPELLARSPNGYINSHLLDGQDFASNLWAREQHTNKNTDQLCIAPYQLQINNPSARELDFDEWINLPRTSSDGIELASLPTSPPPPYLLGGALNSHQVTQRTHFTVNASQCRDIGEPTIRTSRTNSGLDASGTNTTSRPVPIVYLHSDTRGLDTASRLDKEFLTDPLVLLLDDT